MRACHDTAFQIQQRYEVFSMNLCRHCGRSFSRKDVKDRHEERHCPGRAARMLGGVFCDKLDINDSGQKDAIVSALVEQVLTLRTEVQNILSWMQGLKDDNAKLVSGINNIKQDHTKLQEDYCKLKDDNKKLHEKLEAHQSRSETMLTPTVVSGFNQQTNCNNNNTYININNYGKEDVSHITHEEKIGWALEPRQGILSYVEKKHFDPNKPQNHNIRLSSMKREELSVLLDGSWQKQPAKPFLHKVLGKAVDTLAGAIDYARISDDAESYLENINENTQCKDGRASVQSLLYLVANKTNELLQNAQAAT